MLLLVILDGERWRLADWEISRAGAQWRSHETSFTEAAEWDVQTYRYWEQLVKNEDSVTGVAVCGIF